MPRRTLLLAIGFWLTAAAAAAVRLLEAPDGQRAPPPAAAVPVWPRLQTIHGLETLWEVPPQPQRVLFVAHGCAHAGSDFWPPSPRCRHCLGLPEEQLVRLAALQRSYAVIAVSSLDRQRGCWANTAASKSEDLQRLPRILREVMAAEGLQDVPLFAFGASSGGGIVLRLAQVMPEVQGVIAQVVPARPSLLETADGRPFPPVLFAHMAAREPAWAEEVKKTLQYCRRAGIAAAEVRIAPQPVTTELLQRSRLISAAAADAILASLRAAGLLDESGSLVDDPREAAERWQAALRPVAAGALLQSPAIDHIAELLNVAYARHELTGGTAGAALAWLEARGRASIAEFLKQHDDGSL